MRRPEGSGDSKVAPEAESRFELSNRLALRPPECAAALGVTERTLRTWMRHEGLPYVRLNGVVLVPLGPLQEWLGERAMRERRAERLADEVVESLDTSL